MEKTKEHLGIGIIILIYFSLKPLYLGESGTLQISDVFLLFSIIYLLFKSQGKLLMPLKSKNVVFLFGCVLFYQAIDNLIWSFITGDMAMNRRTLYYLFNFLAFLTFIYIGNSIGINRLKRSIAIGSFISVIITAIGIVFFGGVRLRSTGFFNNPNQLGYYGILLLTVVLLCKNQLSKFQAIVIFLSSFWFIVVSLSKASIVAFFCEILVFILHNNKKLTIKALVIQLTLVFVSVITIYYLFFANSDFIYSNQTLYNMRNRIIYMTDENDSNLAYGRGYARVFEMGPHLLWGTGEGAYDRFIAKHGTEVHSTFISLLTCYGLIGLFGYLLIFKTCMGKRKQFIQSAIALLGIFLYAVTHNGIRNTLLWLILALVFIQSCNNNNTAADIE